MLCFVNVVLFSSVVGIVFTCAVKCFVGTQKMTKDSRCQVGIPLEININDKPIGQCVRVRIRVAPHTKSSAAPCRSFAQCYPLNTRGVDDCLKLSLSRGLIYTLLTMDQNTVDYYIQAFTFGLCTRNIRANIQIAVK